MDVLKALLSPPLLSPDQFAAALKSQKGVQRPWAFINIVMLELWRQNPALVTIDGKELPK